METMSRPNSKDQSSNVKILDKTAKAHLLEYILICDDGIYIYIRH
jgi:hypothetical protein